MKQIDTPAPLAHDTDRPGPLALVRSTVETAIKAMDALPYSVVALAARIFPAAVFWQSGRTKVDGLTIKDSTYFLFEHQFALPLIDPALAAWLATAAEHVFPILLVIGLATRFSALALLIMTLVIQVFVFPGAWVTHGLWAVGFLILIAKGPGMISLDHFVAKRFRA